MKILSLFQRRCPCYPRHESHRPVTWSSTIIEQSRPHGHQERREHQAGPCLLGWWRLFNMSCREGGRRGLWRTEPDLLQCCQPTQLLSRPLSRQLACSRDSVCDAGHVEQQEDHQQDQQLPPILLQSRPRSVIRPSWDLPHRGPESARSINVFQ